MNKVGFPVLGTDDYIPYELVKNHETQALKNHGQDIDTLYKRGGLSYVELACVLRNQPFDKNFTEDKAKKFINIIVDRWLIGLTENGKWTIPEKIDINKGLRPCIVTIKTGYEKSETKKAYFHRWFDTCLVIIGQRGVESDRIPCVKGLVEYEDGTMDEHLPDNIRFTDRENG